MRILIFSKQKMWCIYLFVIILITHRSQATSEGNICNKDGVAGLCTNFRRCNSAMFDVIHRTLQTCGYDENKDPIVCCFDHPLSEPNDVPTAAWRPANQNYHPASGSETEHKPGCKPMSPRLRPPHRGWKAWNKCVEYQEKLVFPCRVNSFIGGANRANLCHHSSERLIVGGKDAARYEYPHMVLLGYNKRGELYNRDISRIEWLCGGSLISERFVLTAGHCLSDKNIRNVSYVLIGGYERSDTHDESKIYNVRSLIKYPSYRPSSKYDDIALLELDREVPLDQYTVPVCLHTGDPVNMSMVSATGWGLKQYKGSFSNKLQKVVLDKFSFAECFAKFQESSQMKYGFDGSTQMCYGDKSRSRDTCQGDSGGPIQIKSNKITCMYLIVGVTSFGRACGFVGEPGVYTKIAHYVPWIERIVWP